MIFVFTKVSLKSVCPFTLALLTELTSAPKRHSEHGDIVGYVALEGKERSLKGYILSKLQLYIYYHGKMTTSDVTSITMLEFGHGSR